MTPLYQKLKIWFRENYGHLGYDLSPFYDIDNDLICKFDILRFGRKTEIKELNLEKIMDFTAGDSGLRKLLFDALFRQHGYSVGNDFTPLKQIKEFKL
jgi:hypothetical protein